MPANPPNPHSQAKNCGSQRHCTLRFSPHVACNMPPGLARYVRRTDGRTTTAQAVTTDSTSPACLWPVRLPERQLLNGAVFSWFRALSHHCHQGVRVIKYTMSRTRPNCWLPCSTDATDTGGPHVPNVRQRRVPGRWLLACCESRCRSSDARLANTTCL